MKYINTAHNPDHEAITQLAEILQEQQKHITRLENTIQEIKEQLYNLRN